MILIVAQLILTIHHISLEQCASRGCILTNWVGGSKTSFVAERPTCGWLSIPICCRQRVCLELGICRKFILLLCQHSKGWWGFPHCLLAVHVWLLGPCPPNVCFVLVTAWIWEQRCALNGIVSLISIAKIIVLGSYVGIEPLIISFIISLIICSKHVFILTIIVILSTPRACCVAIILDMITFLKWIPIVVLRIFFIGIVIVIIAVIFGVK